MLRILLQLLLNLLHIQLRGKLDLVQLSFLLKSLHLDKLINGRSIFRLLLQALLYQLRKALLNSHWDWRVLLLHYLDL